MKKKINFKQLIFFAVFFSFSSFIKAQFNENQQYNIVNNANGEFASLEFTSRESSFGCCSITTVFTPSISNGDLFEVETAVRNRFSRPTIENFQKWKFVTISNGVVQVINVRNGRAIDVANSNATPTQQNPNASDRGQQWRVQNSGNLLRFVSVLSGKALSFDRNGTLVQRIVRNGNRRQLWSLRAAEFSEVGDPNEIIQSIIIAPNPASTTTTLFINSNVDDPNATYQINERGFIRLGRIPINIKRGENVIEVDVTGVNPGFHRIDVFFGGKRQFAKNIDINR